MRKKVVKTNNRQILNNVRFVLDHTIHTIAIGETINNKYYEYMLIKDLPNITGYIKILNLGEGTEIYISNEENNDIKGTVLKKVNNHWVVERIIKQRQPIEG